MWGTIRAFPRHWFVIGALILGEVVQFVRVGHIHAGIGHVEMGTVVVVALLVVLAVARKTHRSFRFWRR